MGTSLVLVLLLLLSPLLLVAGKQPGNGPALYSNYWDWKNFSTICGNAPLNKRTNGYKSAPYILNGLESGYGEWPFVAIVSLNGTICTGVIVSSDVVLTAGHCLYGLYFKKPFGILNHLDERYTDAYVLVGKNSLDKADKHEVEHKILKVQEGAYYKRRGFKEENPDFARLWLREPIRFNDYVQTICISKRPEKVYSFLVGPLFFIGAGLWAQTPQVIQPKKILWAQMKPEPLWRLKLDEKENKSTLKFTAEDGKFVKVCSGDAGGPLVALDDWNRWVLIGMAQTSAGKCDKNFFAILENTFVLMPKIQGIFERDFKVGSNEDANDHDLR